MTIRLRPTYVPADYVDQKFLFVGEAPGQTEERMGRPFVGKAGWKLQCLLEELGLKRGIEYGLTNVCKHRPESNKWVGVARREKEYWKSSLLKEISQYSNINTIIALGATALDALVEMKDDVGNPLTFTKMRGCFWRGKVLNPATGKPFKVMVTHHPSNVVQRRASGRLLQKDVEKVLRYAGSKEVEYEETPGVDYLVRDPKQALVWIEFLKKQKLLAYDVETIRYKKKDNTYLWFVDCISFAWSRTEGIEFDLLKREQRAVGYKLSKLFSNPNIRWIGQNVGYDRDALEATFGYRPNGIHYDTLDLHNFLDPGIPHDLGFLSSLFCNRPYYKDEGKHYNSKTSNRSQRLRYNLIDSLATFGVFEELKQLAERSNQWAL